MIFAEEIAGSSGASSLYHIFGNTMSGCGVVEIRHKLHKVYYPKNSVDEGVPAESHMNAAEFVSRLIVQRCKGFRCIHVGCTFLVRVYNK
jgi:hypothetical protein